MKNLTGETQPCLPDLSGRPKTSTMCGLIVLPALPCISNILRKHFNSLHSSNRRHDVFKQPPFVAYRSSPNLRYLLVKAQLTVISNNHFSPGFFRYRQLKLCHLSVHGLTSYTFLFYEWNTLHHFTPTLLVTLKTWSTWLNVTVVICCNLQYIGETKRRLEDRFRACLNGGGEPQVGEVTS